MGGTQLSESEGRCEDVELEGQSGAPKEEAVTCVFLPRSHFLPLSLSFLICEMGVSQVVSHRVALQIQGEGVSPWHTAL